MVLIQKFNLYSEIVTTFLPKIKNYGQNGDEFSCLGDKLSNRPGFLQNFAKYVATSQAHISLGHSNCS